MPTAWYRSIDTILPIGGAFRKAPVITLTINTFRYYNIYVQVRKWRSQNCRYSGGLQFTILNVLKIPASPGFPRPCSLGLARAEKKTRKQTFRFLSKMRLCPGRMSHICLQERNNLLALVFTAMTDVMAPFTFLKRGLQKTIGRRLLRSHEEPASWSVHPPSFYLKTEEHAKKTKCRGFDP